MHAFLPTCMRARGRCTHARGRACQHEARARMLPDVHASIQARARMLTDVHASTRQMHACSRRCMPTRGTCTHARGRACQHEADALMLAGVQVSTRQMHACSPTCTPARGTCMRPARRADLHALASIMFGVTYRKIRQRLSRWQPNVSALRPHTGCYADARQNKRVAVARDGTE